MEEDAAPSQTPVVPLALSVLALFLGGAGLYFGYSANQRISALEESGAVARGEAAEAAKVLGRMDTRVQELSAGVEELQSSVRRSAVYRNETEKGLKKVATEVNANREQIVKNAKSISEMVSGVSRSVASVAEAPASSEAGPAPEPGEGKLYRIQPGDTFAKVAAREGISLQELLDANPSADPRRLAIGQEIVIPVN